MLISALVYLHTIVPGSLDYLLIIAEIPEFNFKYMEWQFFTNTQPTEKNSTLCLRSDIFIEHCMRTSQLLILYVFRPGTGI